MTSELRNFLSIPYDELEEMNLQAKEARKNRAPTHKIQEERLKYLTDEKRIKAVTVLFSDLEGRLHMLDYDKKFLIKSWDNLTFDGSSIRGFTAQRESDLRLSMDWSAFYWAPSDVFGSGKVLVFRTGDRQGWDSVQRRYPRRVEGHSPMAAQEGRLHVECGERDRRLSLRRRGCRTALPRDGKVRVCEYGRLLSLAAGGSADARSSIRRRKYSARWDFRMRKTIRKWRRHNSK